MAAALLNDMFTANDGKLGVRILHGRQYWLVSNFIDAFLVSDRKVMAMIPWDKIRSRAGDSTAQAELWRS